ncbi:MAG: PD-(D/E)XK nuclease domain-containing protein, partial [Lachnospiraceae bacterium]|nr:PD-(D/E)XK nuclease domain-containing protein [Lachnospiraceae bacterium]
PHTDKPALVVELKYDKNAETAIKQIRERRYTQALEGYSGEILLVGINYDKEKKAHSCVIEKMEKR